MHPGDSWLSECTRGRNGLKLFYIRSLTAVGEKKKKTLTGKGHPGLKGAKTVTHCSSVTIGHTFNIQKGTLAFKLLIQFYLATVTPEPQTLYNLNGGDSALQTHSTSARARSEDAQERQANEPGELYPFCFRKRKS